MDEYTAAAGLFMGNNDEIAQIDYIDQAQIIRRSNN